MDILCVLSLLFNYEPPAEEYDRAVYLAIDHRAKHKVLRKTRKGRACLVMTADRRTVVNYLSLLWVSHRHRRRRHSLC